MKDVQPRGYVGPCSLMRTVKALTCVSTRSGGRKCTTERYPALRRIAATIDRGRRLPVFSRQSTTTFSSLLHSPSSCPSNHPRSWAASRTREARGQAWGQILSGRKRSHVARACSARRWGQRSRYGLKIPRSSRSCSIPMAASGSTSFPEEIFDLDFPGHYFRRIKSMSITLPCVVGPYMTISCTLRLLKNSIRINTANGDNGYPHNTDDHGLPADDTRFIENNIPVKAIAASSAQNDSGVFKRLQQAVLRTTAGYSN
jgi:Tc toxin complex TcA C-terminal TcB-binding domain